MARILVIAGLLLLAVLVPLAALPLAIAALVITFAAAPFPQAMRNAARPFPPLAVVSSRAPPQR